MNSPLFDPDTPEIVISVIKGVNWVTKLTEDKNTFLLFVVEVAEEFDQLSRIIQNLYVRSIASCVPVRDTSTFSTKATHARALMSAVAAMAHDFTASSCRSTLQPAEKHNVLTRCESA